MTRRRVVVTGLGCISPVGNTVADAWANLLAGQSGIGLISKFDTSAFSCRIAGEVKGFNLEQYISAKEARTMDSFIHFGIAAAVQAVEDAGLPTGEALDDELATRIACVIGSGIGGLPMIAWSIKAAQQSQCFDRIIVSTDDAEIAQVAKAHGADVPFIRPAELSDDHTGTIPVVAHAIAWQNQHSTPARDVCCLYATAPFMQADDLQRGLGILLSTGADYAFSVTTYSFPIQRAIRITTDMRVEMFSQENFNTRSQDLEEAWHDAGQFYWGTAKAWLSGKLLFTPDAAPVPLPRYRVQDIDTPEDWMQAEMIFNTLNYER